MKNKFFLVLMAGIFATITIFNMHLAQNNHNTDITLADISVMAQAGGENGGECGDPIWNVTITVDADGSWKCSCTLGGIYYCCCN